jgi:3,4-dihydroxy-2-butanone 4-phosphate synthase
MRNITNRPHSVKRLVTASVKRAKTLQKLEVRIQAARAHTAELEHCAMIIRHELAAPGHVFALLGAAGGVQ